MDFEQLITNQHDIFNQLCDNEKYGNDRNNNNDDNRGENNNQNNYNINDINDTNNNYHSINDKNKKNNGTNGDEDKDDEKNVVEISNYNETIGKHNHISSNNALDDSADYSDPSSELQFDNEKCAINQPGMNRYCNAEEAFTPNLDDILNEAVNNNENFHFDFDDHVLPPCFDSLIINAEDQLLNSPHLDLLKLESPQNFDESKVQESPQEYASSAAEPNPENEANETPRPNEQEDSIGCLPSQYFDSGESNPSPDSNLPGGLMDCERAEVTDEAMSEKEIQLIREVNKTLNWECILPVKVEDREEHGEQQKVYDQVVEPLQEVPCLEDYYKDTFSKNHNTDELRNDPERDICFDDDVFNDLPLDFDDGQTLDMYGSKPKQVPSLSSPAFSASSSIKSEDQEEKKYVECSPEDSSRRDTIRSLSERHSYSSSSSSISPGTYKVEPQTRREKSAAARHRRQSLQSSGRLHSHKQTTPRKYVRNIPHVYNRNIVTANQEAACALGYNRAYATNFHQLHHQNNSNIPHMYNNMVTNNYGEYPVNMYDKRVFRRMEPGGMSEANYFQGCSTGMYNEAVEAQLHHDVWSRGEDLAFSRDALDVYLPNEQDVIRRYIVGDKRHVPVPPFSGEIQQLIKRERKKHKNRVAASKCRKKKLEREAQLEVRVNCLKDRSAHLTTVARELRNQATGLKQKIVDHINAGCTLNPNVLPMGINQYYM